MPRLTSQFLLQAFSLGAIAVLPVSAWAQAGEPSHVVDVSIKTPAKPLSEAEQKIAANVDSEREASNAFLKQLVDINSGTHNLEGVRDVAKLIMPQLTALGFKTEFHPMDKIQRAGDVVAVHPCPLSPGNCGKRILLIGHMDTVFEKDQPMQAYTIVPGTEGNTATGQGVMDMKGGLAIIVHALRAMQAAGVLVKTEITVVLSGDEEAPGTPYSVSRADMIAAAKQNDIALEFENTAQEKGEDYGSTARRSSIEWQLTTTGKTGHSSDIFSNTYGDGAINEMVRILDTYRTQLPEPELTFNFGLLLGGTTVTMDESAISGSAAGKINVIPDAARANGDIRTLTPEQTERVEAKMKQIALQHLAKTGANLSFSEGYPSMPPTDGNRSLLRMLNTVNQSLDVPQMKELDPMQRGAGDVSFVAPYVDALAGIGPTGKGAHAPGETIDLSRQPLQTKRAAILMYRLSQIGSTAKLTALYPAAASK